MSESFPERTMDRMMKWLIFPLLFVQGKPPLYRVAGMLIALPWFVVWMIPWVLVGTVCMVWIMFLDLGKSEL